jgi:hypothetical protein
MPAGLGFIMHCVDESREAGLRTPVHPGNSILRRAIRQNIVSFPSQIPVFLKDPPADMQWRVVSLFFVCGWNSVSIATRFHVPRHRIWQIVHDWCIRALALGYVEVIDPEAFSACCRVDLDFWDNRGADRFLSAIGDGEGARRRGPRVRKEVQAHAVA